MCDLGLREEFGRNGARKEILREENFPLSLKMREFGGNRDL